MSIEHENLGPEHGRKGSEGPAVSETISSERRRAILRGLTKGAAIAGASVPLQSLAGAGQRMKLKRSGNDYVCSVSGQLSVLASAGATSVTQCIVVNKCDFYKTVGNWPDVSSNVRGCQVGAAFWKNTDTFKSCFNSTTTTMRSRTLINIITNYQTSDEAYWILAVLNARSFNTSSFPYTPQEVLAQFGSTSSSSALTLHKSIVTGL